MSFPCPWRLRAAFPNPYSERGDVKTTDSDAMTSLHDSHEDTANLNVRLFSCLEAYA